MNWIQRFDPRRSWLGFLGLAGLGLVLLFTVLDPQPSRGLNSASRLIFWTLHIFIPLALAQGCQIILVHRRLSFGGVWALTGAAGVVASALFAPLALALDLAFAVAGGLAQEERFSRIEVFDEWLGLAPPVMLVWVGLNAVRFLRLPAVAPLDRPTPPAGDLRPQFMERVPAGRRGQLVAMSAELHYLRVYTTLGDALILQGFGDAMSELGPAAGLQVHRSHWINPSFFAELSREGGRMEVRLTTGLTLPVARSRRSEVVAILEGEPEG